MAKQDQTIENPECICLAAGLLLAMIKGTPTAQTEKEGMAA